MMRAYASACRVLAGVNPSIPTKATVSKVVDHDIAWHAPGTPYGLGESDDDNLDSVTVDQLRAMTLRKMRKIVLKKAKVVQGIAKRKYSELRAVDKGLLEERDFMNAQTNKWKADRLIHHFDKTIAEDPENDGVHRRHPNSGNHDQIAKDLLTVAQAENDKKEGKKGTGDAPSAKKDDMDLEKEAVAKLPAGPLKASAERQLEQKEEEANQKADAAAGGDPNAPTKDELAQQKATIKQDKTVIQEMDDGPSKTTALEKLKEREETLEGKTP